MGLAPNSIRKTPEQTMVVGACPHFFHVLEVLRPGKLSCPPFARPTARVRSEPSEVGRAIRNSPLSPSRPINGSECMIAAPLGIQ